MKKEYEGKDCVAITSNPSDQAPTGLQYQALAAFPEGEKGSNVVMAEDLAGRRESFPHMQTVKVFHRVEFDTAYSVIEDAAATLQKGEEVDLEVLLD